MRLFLLFHLQMCKTESLRHCEPYVPPTGTARVAQIGCILMNMKTWNLPYDKLYEHIQKHASSPRAMRHMMTAGIYPALKDLVHLIIYQQLKAHIVVHSVSAFQANNH